MDPNQFNKLPREIREYLLSQGVTPYRLEPHTPKSTDRSYTSAGLPSLVGEYNYRDMNPAISGTTIRSGNTFPTKSVILHNKNPTQPTDYDRGHELEHVLANQGLGRAPDLNLKWDELVGKEGGKRGEIVQRLLEHAPHLVKNWGLDPKDNYFLAKDINSMPNPQNALFEQLASLSALEQQANKRLVDDPYIRKNVLKTPAEREAYDALTGLRQTRLDAKDLPPYTRQKEKEEKKPEGMWDRIVRNTKDIF